MEGGDVLAFAIVVEGATVGERQAHVPLVKDQVCEHRRTYVSPPPQATGKLSVDATAVEGMEASNEHGNKTTKRR